MLSTEQVSSQLAIPMLEKERAKCKITPLLRANYIYAQFKRKWGIDIIAASNANMARLRTEIGSLSADEQMLYDLVVENIVFSHATEYLEPIRTAGNMLSPLKLRQYRGESTGNRNTGTNGGVDGNLFFTVEFLGISRTPSFLSAAVDVIHIEPNKYSASDAANVLNYAWIGTHLDEFSCQSHHSRILFCERPGDASSNATEYTFWHSTERSGNLGQSRLAALPAATMPTTATTILEPLRTTKTTHITKQPKQLFKHYKYTRANGTAEFITVTFADEIFAGKHILPGIALQLIQHLRRLGNNYSRQLFAKLHLLNTTNKTAEQIRLVAEVMHAFMPTTMYPEVKIPGELNVSENHPGVKITKKRALEIRRQSEQAIAHMLNPIFSSSNKFARLFEIDYSTFQPRIPITPSDLVGTDRLEYVKACINNLSKQQAVIISSAQAIVKYTGLEALLAYGSAYGDLPDIIKMLDANEANGILPLIIMCSHAMHSSAKKILIKYIVDCGAKVCAKEFYDSPLKKAFDARDYDLVRYLLTTPFANPIEPAVMQFTLINHKKIAYFDNAIAYFCREGNLEMLKLLYVAGADMHRFASFWLCQASHANSLECVLYLTDSCGVELDKLDYLGLPTPLLKFASHNNLEGVAAILKRHCNPNLTWPIKDKHYGFSALHFAAMHGNIDMINLLLRQDVILIY